MPRLTDRHARNLWGMGLGDFARQRSRGGVDGALVDAAGNLLYPVISWKCPRTAEVMKHIGKYISQEELNRISGVGAFAFNTIYKLVWLKENRPELLENCLLYTSRCV